MAGGGTRKRLSGRCLIGLLCFAGTSHAEDPASSAPVSEFALAGTVVGADGASQDAFTVTVFPRHSGTPQVHSFHDADGRLAVDTDQAFAAVAVHAPRHAIWFRGRLRALEGRYEMGRVRLAPGRTLEGRVIDANTGLAIPDADVRYAPLEAHLQRHDQAAAWPSSATTDDDGHFTLDNLPRSSVPLQVAAAGYAKPRNLTLAAKAKRLEIRLGRGATIHGTLSLPDGGPAAGHVTLAPATRTPWPWTRHNLDAAGRFAFENVTPGDYRLSALSASGVVGSQSVTVSEGDDAAFDLRLDPLGEVAGWITGLLEGESASIAVYRPGDDGSRTHVKSSEQRVGNGRFELHGILDGAYIVQAQAGGRTLSAYVDVAGGHGTADFAFLGRSRLTGRVLAGERPIPNLPVEVVPKHAGLPSGSYALSDDLGGFDFRGLEDGDYALRVQLGLRGTWRAFDITVSGGTNFDARLGPHAISGTLPPTFRNHVVQARLVPSDDEPVVFRVFVDGTGKYRFDGLEDGNYVVSHSSPDYAGMREVVVYGASVEGVDLHPTFVHGLPDP